MSEMDDEELLRALGVEVTPIKSGGRTALEERLIAGFEDIMRFVDTSGHAPRHGEERDIFERLYAVTGTSSRGTREQVKRRCIVFFGSATATSRNWPTSRSSPRSIRPGTQCSSAWGKCLP